MTWTAEEMRRRIGALPRVSLAALPTPLERCERISKALGPRFWVKRDDLTGLALGGNKTRHLELILGRAVAQGADCLITMAAVQSNQCRQAAAAGAKLGLPVHLVLRGERPERAGGNLLLDRLMGAEVHFAPELDDSVASLASALKAEGRRPYVVDLVNDASPDQELAAVSYMSMMAELADQLPAPPDWIYLSSGSGGSATTAGTWLGCRALGMSTHVVGVTAAPTRESVREDTLEIARRAASLVGCPELCENASGLTIERGFVGEGYGIPTGRGAAAMSLAARAEGLVLDPYYTGKALAALIAHIRDGAVSREQSVVFVHTGGTPLVFLHELGIVPTMEEW
jgi:1-aminocyclopropane-1-carboxylate deaminase/D-cysteine desulfhydrase-like pyridoxal-dependent ACC family enzyme